MKRVDPKTLRPHPLNRLIPDMRPEEWRDFYADIAMRGIRVPLEVLADGTVVDGRHRLQVALELGMKKVPVVDAPLNGERPEVYMMKAAVLRRHLTDDQSAMLAALWKEGNKRQGERMDLTSAGRPAEVQDVSPTRAEAQELFKVSRWKVDQATYVRQRSPELASKVHRGEMTLSNAYRKVKAAEGAQGNEAAQAAYPSGCNVITGPASLL